MFFSFLNLYWGEKAFILVHSQNENRKQKEITNRTLEDTVVNILSSTFRARTFKSITVPIFLLISELRWAAE